MKTCVFIGPSSININLSRKVDIYPPAAMGSIYNAVKAGYKTIALVDGVFGNIPAVWHKEILFALSQGCTVIGGSSMGAIRASELDTYGMVGVGIAYRLFRRGLTDDDEVCLLHAPEMLNYKSLTDPMINVRYTARRMTRHGIFSSDLELIFVTRAKEIFFIDRNKEAIDSCIEQVVSRNDLKRAINLYSKLYFNVKEFDANLVLNLLEHPTKRLMPKCRFEFPFTHHWKEYFEEKVSEIPPLQLTSKMRNEV